VSDLEKAANEIKRLNSKYLILSTPNYLNFCGLKKFIYDWIEGREYWEPWSAHKEGFERFMHAFKLKKAFRYEYEIIDERGLNYKLSWKIPRRVERRLINIERFPILKYVGMNFYCLAVKRSFDDQI
jgi:hypothetical protein